MLAEIRRFVSPLLGAFALVSGWAADSGLIDRSLGPPFTQRIRATLGSVDARVVFIEISDFRCEHCRQFHERVFPLIKEHYIDRGLIRYVVLSAHAPGARPAPELFGVAKLTLERDHYWTSLPALFANAQQHDLAALARSTGIDPAAAAAYVARSATKAAIAEDQAEATRLAVIGTPTFIVRKRIADDEFVEARVDGYESWDYFDQLLSQLVGAEQL